jgi:hypothetical protein
MIPNPSPSPSPSPALPPKSQLTPRPRRTRYQHIHFTLHTTPGGTAFWSCHTNAEGSLLGHIEWHRPWSEWIFAPQADTIWSPACLTDILTFIATATL